MIKGDIVRFKEEWKRRYFPMTGRVLKSFEPYMADPKARGERCHVRWEDETVTTEWAMDLEKIG